MVIQDRENKIKTYQAGYSLLHDALQKYPQEMWHYKVSPKEWSIHEIIIHITDSEANSYIRCRRFIAEPTSTLMAYDENQWSQALTYSQQSISQALALFRELRAGSYNLICTLPEHIWQHQAYHPENGSMTLDDWLDVYAQHVPEHIQQMDTIYAHWKQTQGLV